MSEEDVATAAKLLEQLRSSDLQAKVSAFNQIPLIATTLGPQRTRDEFIAFLNEFTDDEGDALLVLAEKLGELTGYLGGEEFAYLLLDPLETLCGVEEQVVTKQAIESIKKVTAILTKESVLEHVLPVLRKLIKGEWFTTRVSSCYLFPSVYPRVDSKVQRELRSLYKDLCKDKVPMVRRAACSQLGNFLGVIDIESVESEMFDTLVLLSKDEQDSVRLLLPQTLIPVFKMYKDSKHTDDVLHLCVTLCHDPSWRVRVSTASHFPSLFEQLTDLSSHHTDTLLHGFVYLLQDSEAEVRTAAAKTLGGVCKVAGSTKTQEKFLPTIEHLVKDPSVHTRAAISAEIASVALCLDQEQVVQHLVPALIVLLQDSESEVRLNLISTLAPIQNMLTADVLAPALVIALIDLAEDHTWRTRLAVIQHIPLLAHALGQSFFDSKISEMCMNWLGDSVYTIRAAAAVNLARLGDAFGPLWTRTHILPKVISLSSHKSYLYRLTSLFAMREIAPTVGKEFTTSHLLAYIIKLSDDSVPNVRFNIAATLSTLLPQVASSAIKSHVTPCLKKLAQDPDRDVRYFAESSLKDLDAFIRAEAEKRASSSPPKEQEKV